MTGETSKSSYEETDQERERGTVESRWKREHSRQKPASSSWLTVSGRSWKGTEDAR